MGFHKDLVVWQKSIELVTKIYKITATFPKEELFGIVSQIRRAAVSISSNIAEGSGRGHNKEFIQFLNIALGSNAELETQIIISKNLGFINDSIYEELSNEINVIGKLLTGLIKSKKEQLLSNK